MSSEIGMAKSPAGLVRVVCRVLCRVLARILQSQETHYGCADFCCEMMRNGPQRVVLA